jgi:hypothetical protein
MMETAGHDKTNRNIFGKDLLGSYRFSLQKTLMDESGSRYQNAITHEHFVGLYGTLTRGRYIYRKIRGA